MKMQIVKKYDLDSKCFCTFHMFLEIRENLRDESSHLMNRLDHQLGAQEE